MITTTQPYRLAAIAVIADATVLGGCADISGTKRGAGIGASAGATSGRPHRKPEAGDGTGYPGNWRTGNPGFR